jgi:hypothetical protein
MEWFFGPKGLKFSEIGCRPPGVRAWDLYARPTTSTSTASGRWPSCTAEGPDLAPLRRGHDRAAPRPRRPHLHYDGVEQIQQRFGEWIIDMHLPPPGTPTQPVEAGYMANAWMRLRTPTTTAARMLNVVGETVKSAPARPDHSALTARRRRTIVPSAISATAVAALRS